VAYTLPTPRALSLTTGSTLFFAEHGSYHRVNRRPSLRRMVHPKHGARSACVRWSQKFSAPSSDQAGQSFSTTTAAATTATATTTTTATTWSAAIGYQRQKCCLGRNQDGCLGWVPKSPVLRRSLYYLLLYCGIQLRTSVFISCGRPNLVVRYGFGPQRAERVTMRMYFFTLISSTNKRPKTRRR